MNKISREYTNRKGHRTLILVVEDIPKNMEVVCNILRKKGYRLAMAGNGKHALDMLKNIRPDLILMDIMMPEMDGFEACQKIKENPAIRDIPLIFLTAKADTEDLVKGFDLGAVDYVTKPFKAAELLSRVNTHIELTRAREHLKVLNATKDTFFSIIAHDLKDPLQFLLLSAETMHENYDSMTEAKRKDYIQRFFKNSNQISLLVKNLLQWARSQTGGLTFTPEKIHLRSLALEAVDLQTEWAAKKNIAIQCDIDVGLTAFADPNVVRTVFRNLVSNAIKFTHDGGNVTISAANNPNGGSVEVKVSDTGVGMEPEDAEKLFRLEIKRTTVGTAKEKGSGLGLILCREFLQKTNGDIKVQSQPGKGSTFTFYLPG